MKNKIWQDMPTKDLALDLRAWLATYACENMPWLLIHADDGVIWGMREPDGDLRFSSDVFSDPDQYSTIAVKVRAETLQQARIFGPGGEILVWRSHKGFTARRIEDDGQNCESFDETYLLWYQGKFIEKEGFTLLQEGQQGNRYAPPVAFKGKRPCLRVRHYIDYDDRDQAYIALSRLVALASSVEQCDKEV